MKFQQGFSNSPEICHHVFILTKQENNDGKMRNYINWKTVRDFEVL